MSATRLQTRADWSRSGAPHGASTVSRAALSPHNPSTQNGAWHTFLIQCQLAMTSLAPKPQDSLAGGWWPICFLERLLKCCVHTIGAWQQPKLLSVLPVPVRQSCNLDPRHTGCVTAGQPHYLSGPCRLTCEAQEKIMPRQRRGDSSSTPIRQVSSLLVKLLCHLLQEAVSS